MHSTDHIIDTYTPRLVEPETWAQMSSFVRHIIRDRYAAGRSIEAARLALNTLTGFAEWVLITGIGELTVGILRAGVIDAYTAHRHSEVDGAVAERERKRLRTMAGLRNTPEHRKVKTTATPSAPYSRDEQDDVHRWTEWQPTDYRRRSACGVAALGLGCGLTGSEMMQVRNRDIITLDDGLLGVQISDRTVPVLAEWHDELAISRTDQLDDYLIAPRCTTRSPLGLKGALVTLGPNSPTSQKMRATWLLTHVNASTNIYTLMSAAGLSAPDFLRRLAAFADYASASLQASAFRLSSEAKR